MHENTTKADFFHSNIIKVNTEHKNKFLESLIAITQINWVGKIKTIYINLE